jgi:hypothetical protein
MTQGKKEGASPSGVRSLLTRSVPPSSSADRDLPCAQESGDHASTRRGDGSGRRRPLHDGGRRHRAAEPTSSPGVQDPEPNWSPDAPVDAQRRASSAEEKEKGSLDPTESEQRLSPRSLSSCRPLRTRRHRHRLERDAAIAIMTTAGQPPQSAVLIVVRLSSGHSLESMEVRSRRRVCAEMRFGLTSGESAFRHATNGVMR